MTAQTEHVRAALARYAYLPVIPAVLAYIDQQQAEIERLKSSLAMNEMAFNNNKFVLEQAQSEIERLRAAIKDAYEEGFADTATYNDSPVNYVEDTWLKSVAFDAAMKG